MGTSVSTNRQDGVRTVTVVGEVDLAISDRLAQEINDAVGATDGLTTLVDLSQVTFLDSTGISVLLKGRRLANEQGRRYRVIGATGLVREVLEITGVWRYLSDPVD